LGKTTLAQIVSHEMGVGFRPTAGPILSKAGDLAAILTNLQERDVLFIDEIHRLNVAVEEMLYAAMEDCKLDLVIGEGPAARSIRYIAEFYDGGPVGVETIAAGLSEQRDAIEETIEPFLLQLGFIQRTPRGRLLTRGSFEHLGMKMPKGLTGQLTLLATEDAE